MPKTLGLTIEVSGCHTTCAHCWARGGPYPAMPLDRVKLVLEQAKNFCREAGLTFAPAAMHDLLAHPEAAHLIQLFAEYSDEDSGGFEPIATNGVSLAIRPDWRGLFDAAQSAGVRTLWFTFHGANEVHDHAVNRQGAYNEMCLAINRAHDLGFRCGCNVYITKANLGSLDALIFSLQTLRMEEVFCEVANYVPTARCRAYEAQRPELADLLPYANQIAEWSAIYKDIWTTLEDYTEGAYYKKARLPDGAAPTSFDHPLNLEYLQVVCASTLNLHTGKAGTHGPLLGNLRKEPVARVLEKALTHEPVSMNHLYFHGELPPLRTIAEQVGRADGQEIYFSASDMRLRWLDVALQNRRRF